MKNNEPNLQNPEFSQEPIIPSRRIGFPSNNFDVQKSAEQHELCRQIERKSPTQKAISQEKAILLKIQSEYRHNNTSWFKQIAKKVSQDTGVNVMDLDLSGSYAFNSMHDFCEINPYYAGNLRAFKKRQCQCCRSLTKEADVSIFFDDEIDDKRPVYERNIQLEHLSEKFVHLNDLFSLTLQQFVHQKARAATRSKTYKFCYNFGVIPKLTVGAHIVITYNGHRDAIKEAEQNIRILTKKLATLGYTFTIIPQKQTPSADDSNKTIHAESVFAEIIIKLKSMHSLQSSPYDKENIRHIDVTNPWAYVNRCQPIDYEDEYPLLGSETTKQKKGVVDGLCKRSPLIEKKVLAKNTRPPLPDYCGGDSNRKIMSKFA